MILKGRSQSLDFPKKKDAGDQRGNLLFVFERAEGFCSAQKGGIQSEQVHESVRSASCLEKKKL